MGDHFYFFSRDKIANNRVIYSILTVLFSIFVLNQSIEYYEHNAMPAKEPVVIGSPAFCQWSIRTTDALGLSLIHI